MKQSVIQGLSFSNVADVYLKIRLLSSPALFSSFMMS